MKGRAGIGEIALTANEYKTAQSLGDEYWLYVVFNCASEPQVTAIQNPARLEWEALSKIDCYRIGADGLLRGASLINARYSLQTPITCCDLLRNQQCLEEVKFLEALRNSGLYRRPVFGVLTPDTIRSQF